MKYTIVPNWITLPMIVFGLFVTSYYYITISDFTSLFYYYLSVMLVYLINYILWRLGVWAGGDVKLFTAISTLFVSDYLSIFYDLLHVSLPLYNDNISILTITLMINSIISIVPIILVIITYNIIKNKRHLINKLYSSIAFNESFILVNSLTISIFINGLLNIDNIILKLITLSLLSYAYTKIIRKKAKINLLISVLLIVYLLTKGNLMPYITKYIIILIIFTIINIIQTNLLKEALSTTIKSDQLEESMVLTYKLCYDNERYYFNQKSISDNLKNKDTPIINNQASGLTDKDIKLLKKLIQTKKLDDRIPIKKTMPFAPYILIGLIITTTIGSMLKFILYILGAIL